LGAGPKEIIKASGIVLKWAGSRTYGVAFGHSGKHLRDH
jgi:hypothetical protein